MSYRLLCYDCNPSEVYRTLDDLEAHVASDHLNLVPYECPTCKYAKFPTEFALVSHCHQDHQMTEFSIKYRYTPELSMKKKDLQRRLERCIAMAHGAPEEKGSNDPVSTTDEHGCVKMEDDIPMAQLATMAPMALGLYADPSIHSYHAFLGEPKLRSPVFSTPSDEAFSRHEEEKTGGSSKEGSEDAMDIARSPTPERNGKTKAAKKKEKVPCELCQEVISKQRSSMVYHTNTRHSKFILYKCGYCGRTWHTIAKSDVIKHIKSHHAAADGSYDLTNVFDYRKELNPQLKEWTAKCFPEKKKQRIGYQDPV